MTRYENILKSNITKFALTKANCRLTIVLLLIVMHWIYHLQNISITCT